MQELFLIIFTQVWGGARVNKKTPLFSGVSFEFN
jgi:hypothetical protein